MTRRAWMHDGGELRLLWSAAHHHWHRVTGVALEQGVKPLLVPNVIPIALYPRVTIAIAFSRQKRVAFV